MLNFWMDAFKRVIWGDYKSPIYPFQIGDIVKSRITPNGAKCLVVAFCGDKVQVNWVDGSNHYRTSWWPVVEFEKWVN